MRNDTPRLRLGMLGVIAVSLFAALFARLWYLQVLASPEYQLQATANQRREIIEPAPRGRILDRNGVVLVDNRLSFIVSLDRTVLRDLEDADRADVLARLTAELAPVEQGITVEVLEQRLASNRFSPYTPVPVAEDIPEDLAVYLTENRGDFHGALHVESRAIRTYPYGQLAAHVLGYVGAINDEEYGVRQESPLGVPAHRRDREVRRRAHLRGRAARRARAADPRGRRPWRHDPRARLPGAGRRATTSTSASTVRVQAVAEVALAEELERARGRRVEQRRHPGRPGRVRRRHRSQQRVDPRHGVVPDLQPGGLHRRHRRPRVGLPQRPRQLLPADQPHDPGPVRAGLDLQAHHRLRRPGVGGHHARSRPSATVACSACPAAPAAAAPSATPGRGRGAGSTCSEPSRCRATCTSTTSAPGSGSTATPTATRSRPAAEQFGLGADTGVPLPNELSGWVPTPENTAPAPRGQPRRRSRTASGTRATTSTWPSARATSWSRRCSSPTPTPPSPTAAPATRPTSPSRCGGAGIG